MLSAGAAAIETVASGAKRAMNIFRQLFMLLVIIFQS